MEEIKEELKTALSKQPYNYPFNGLVTANNINQIINHIDYKLNIIIKAISTK